LVVALLIAALIALVLGSYLSLNLGTARLAQRTFDRGAAFHLAEAGLEEGLWTYNRLLAGQTDAWQGWQTGDDAAWRLVEGFALTSATSGKIKIYASPVTPDENDKPLLVALATVQSPGGAPVTQMIETTLRRRSFFAAGLVARESLAFRGRNTTFDSWDSDPDRDPATPSVPYEKAKATDTGGMATGAATSADAVLNGARINGYVHTSGLDLDVGNDGFIGPFGTTTGEVDPSRVSKNFRADFPVISAPGDGTLITKFGETLGTLGTATSWRANSLSLKGNATLTILGHVTLTLTDLLSAISLVGNASIIVPAGSSLTLYAEGDVQLAGNGFTNTNAAPAAFQLWSTATGYRLQRISISGNGDLRGVIYAPEASVTINGNGSIAGSIIAKDLTFNGNAAFHYDLALGALNKHAPYGSAGWRVVDDPATRAARLLLVDR
jgi:hypothetical protein